MKKYKLLVFDFDGTLVDTAPDIALHANDVLREYGFECHTAERVKMAVGHGVHELLKGLSSGFGGDAERLEEAVLLFKKRYWDHPVVKTVPYPGVEANLSGPLKVFKKAIVTNKPHQLTQKILERLSMGRYFDHLIGLDAGFPAKPDPASLEHIMREANVSAAETLYFGDSRVDAETCLRAGVDFAWVSYGYDRLEGHKPKMTFENAYDWERVAAYAGEEAQAV
jgi:phosphoglycolate phosphatase